MVKNRYKVCGNEVIIFLQEKDGVTLKTKISISDLEKVKSFPNRWRASYSDSTKSFYVYGYLDKRTVNLHRWIMNPEKKFMVDHINHDTLDNTRENLRIITGTGNQLNKNTKGVYFDRKRELWIARLQVNGVRKILGSFNTREEAIDVVVKAKETAIARELNSVEAAV
ncbi:AP2 domain protein [compost metagenome]